MAIALTMARPESWKSELPDGDSSDKTGIMSAYEAWSVGCRRPGRWVPVAALNRPPGCEPTVLRSRLTTTGPHPIGG